MASALTHRNLPLLLLQAREAVLSHFRPIITHFGLTEQQWRILRTLSENESMEPRQIAEVCMILGPSLAGVLARMDELGLVERRRVDTDQRRVLVSLTAKSRDLVKRMAPLIEARDRHRIDDLVDARHFQLGRISISAAHLMGGCGMGRSAADSVTDAWGRVHGLPWLRVADASLFPDALEINPDLTLMALADRAAEAVLNDAKA